MNHDLTEPGRIIRDEVEDIWTVGVEDGNLPKVQNETLPVVGDGGEVIYMNAGSLYESDEKGSFALRLLTAHT